MGLEGIQTSRCPQRPPEAQEGCGLEQMCVEPAVPCCHAHGLCHSSQSRGTAIPSSKGAELPELTGCRNGKDGERCLPYLRGQIASSCGQIKNDGDGLEEGVRFPCKANRLSLFQRTLAAARLAFWAGNLLCRRGKSSRVDDVRAGTRVADFSLFAEYCFISPCRGCCCFLSAPARDGCPPARFPGLATGFAPVLECSFIGRLCLALMSCTALIAI